MRMLIEGPQIVQGTVQVSGAKNSATRVLAASLLSSGKIRLRNFPLALKDVREKMKFMNSMGVVFVEDEDLSEVEISTDEVSISNVSDFDLPIRTTYLLAAGMLARDGYARIPYPGGCKIGSRGYDLHVMIWENMGCNVVEKEEYIEIVGNLQGEEIDFPISTVGGTENALMCASISRGETLIRNAYVTPEVHDLILFLREMGAEIYLEGSSHIRIIGNDGLLKGASFSIMPDRIEALTWIVLGVASGGSLRVVNVPFHTMEVPLVHLRDAGIDIYRNSDSVLITPDSIGPHGIQPFELACGTHPGVISDMQPFFSFLALFGNGRSTIYDYRYPERIAYAEELEKFSGGSIDVFKGKIVVKGSRGLKAASTRSTDLRGSMSLIMAAICASGKSQVDDVELALRGYNQLPRKLTNLGVQSYWEG